MATTYNYGIRDALNKKGVDNARIGYSNGYVTIDGKSFIKSDASNNGRALTSQQNFDNTWNQYSQPSQASPVKSPMVQAANTVKSTPQATYTPPTSPTADTLGRINDFISKQAGFQYTAPEAFSYDQTTDPAYQAQLAEAKRNVANQQADTNAFLRGNGQGKSSYSEMVANQVGTDAMQSISNDLVPALMQQAYQRYSDDANRNMQVQQLNYGVGQDAIGNLSNLYGLQDNEYFQKPIAEAQLTGNYLPTEARQAINQILGLKQQAEASGVTAQERAGFSQQADMLRSQLQAMGIDPSFYGSDRTRNQAASNNPGIRTLAGQQMDLTNEQFAYQKARDAISDQQWKLQFDQNVQQFGLSHALQVLGENNQQAYREASLVLSQDENLRSWLNYRDQLVGGGESATKYSGMTANQVYNVIRDGVSVEDLKTGALSIPTDPETKEKIYTRVMGAGLPDGEDSQVMSMLGLTPTEIASFDKQYGIGASSGN